MQVVSLRRIEGEQPAKKRRSVFYLVPRMVLLGFIVTPITLAIYIKAQDQPVQAKQPAVINQAVLSANIGQPFYPDHILPESGDAASFLANQVFQALPPPTPDCTKYVCVALTFDDGPRPDSTPKLLTILEHHNVQATFFEIGRQVKGNESLIKRMQADGDDIGNHSWSHPSFLKLKPEQINKQVEETRLALIAAGAKNPTLVRPPYGDFDLGMLKSINHPVILWNVDPKDWSFKDPKQIVTSVERVIKPGAIVVMHDKVTTADALDKILKDLSPRYHFVTVTELLNLKPDSQGAYIGR